MKAIALIASCFVLGTEAVTKRHHHNKSPFVKLANGPFSGFGFRSQVNQPETNSLFSYDPNTPQANPANIDRKHLTFHRAHDHINYEGRGLGGDADQVIVTITNKGAADAKQCDSGEWAIVNYKGYENDTMKFVQDSKVARQGKPAYFRIGNFEASKCWDIAFQQMRAG